MRTGWLKVMYVANIIISGPIGLGWLVVPDTMLGLFGVPAGEPISMGIAYGAVPLGFGLAGIVGLWRPVRLSPVLGLQIVYKLAFLVGVVFPMAVAGRVPMYSAPVIGIFVFFIIGDALVVPWRYLTASQPEESDRVSA